MARSALGKPPARLTFSVLSVIAIGGYNVWLRENVEAQLLILGLLLAMTGLPHGAVDPAIARQAGLWRGVPGLLKFSLGYLTLSVSVVGVWFVLPELFIVPMLSFSAWHFSGDWQRYLGRVPSVAISTSVITLPALFHPAEVLAIFAVLAPAGSQIIVDGMALISIVSSLAVAYCCLKTRQPSVIVLAELVILLCAAYALPPIAYFTVYFCLLHSPLHLNQSMEQLGLVKTLVYAVPFTVLSFGAGALLFVSLPDIDFSFQLMQVVFVGLFALTVPHMLLIGVLNQDSRGKAG